jgi:hypothetical protein
MSLVLKEMEMSKAKQAEIRNIIYGKHDSKGYGA